MEADISTLRKTGHFYFALTVARRRGMPAAKMNSVLASIPICRGLFVFDRGPVAQLGARLPCAHTTRLQRLHALLLTTYISNKSGNLLFAQR
jgi:hypothetical protein